MLKELKKNAADIVTKHGFRIATVIYGVANGTLLYNYFAHPHEADIFKNIITPLTYIASNVMGLLDKPRTTNTIGLAGTVSTGISFVMAPTTGVEYWAPLAVTALGATGQYMGSLLAPKKLFSPPKKEKTPDAAQHFKKNLWGFGFVRGAGIQTFVGLLVTAGAYLTGKPDLIMAAKGWNVGDGIKLSWAILNAKKDLKEQRLQIA